MKLGRFIALVLVAHLLAMPATSGMLVLCVGSDGHVAVESASTSLCCRERETASSPCCDDVELSVDSAMLTIPPQKVSPAAAVLCRVPVLAANQRRVSAGAFPLATESPVAASLRTVVLRT